MVDVTLASLSGDRLLVKLDAVPDDNVFDVALALSAPADGVVAGLIGAEAPVNATLAGTGSWKKWDGRLRAASQSDRLADVTLTAREGLFTAKGFVQPGKIGGTGMAASVLAPRTEIDLSPPPFAERVAEIEGGIASPALTIGTKGVIDLAQGEFADLAIDFRLRRPALLARNVSGRNVRGKLLLNGAFAAPTVNYAVTAERLAFDTTGLEGLTANGEARWRADRMIIPVNARARRVTGVNAAAGGLLTNVRLDGDLAYANSRILSDNLKIRSDRIEATAILVGDIAKGVYTGGLKGRVNGYRIETVGLFNVDADVNLETRARSGYALTGTVRARSTRLFSPGVQNFLGGQMFVTAGIRYGTDGLLRITRANVVAPDFRMNQGRGTYSTASGRVIFDGSGFSDSYGPLAVAH